MPVARIMEQALRIHLGCCDWGVGAMVVLQVKMLTGTPSMLRLPSTSVKSILDDWAGSSKI